MLSGVEGILSLRIRGFCGEGESMVVVL